MPPFHRERWQVRRVCARHHLTLVDLLRSHIAPCTSQNPFCSSNTVLETPKSNTFTAPWLFRSAFGHRNAPIPWDDLGYLTHCGHGEVHHKSDAPLLQPHVAEWEDCVGEPVASFHAVKPSTYSITSRYNPSTSSKSWYVRCFDASMQMHSLYER